MARAATGIEQGLVRSQRSASTIWRTSGLGESTIEKPSLCGARTSRRS
jgi:hypothetical protein